MILNKYYDILRYVYLRMMDYIFQFLRST